MPVYPRQGLRILTIDSGDIRNFTSLAIIENIQDRIGKEPYQLFDMIAGTGYGGFLAILLGCLGIPVKECFTWLQRIFSIKAQSKHDRTIQLESIIANILSDHGGDSLRMSDEKNKVKVKRAQPQNVHFKDPL